MNHRHRKILHALFAHPTNANIPMTGIEAVFRELGGEVEERHGRKMSVKLNGHTAIFPHSGHSVPTDEVFKMRKFIETCGIDPEKDYPL